MALSTSGIKGKMGATRENIFKRLNVIRSLGNRKAETSLETCPEQGKITTYNVQANMLETQRVLEVETEKAFIIKVSRHDSWKAGGPC